MALVEKQVLKDHSRNVFDSSALAASQEQQASAADRALLISAAQERIWFLEQMEPGNPTNVVFHVFRVSGKLNHEALGLALDELARRHETLRTTFAPVAIYAGVDGRPLPILAHSALSALSIIDLNALPEAERETRLADVTKGEARQPFDLSKGPLYRTKLIRLAEDEHLLLLGMHRMIADHKSSMIFVRELFCLYDSFANHSQFEKQSLMIQYSTAAGRQHLWLQTEDANGRIESYKQLLKGAPDLLELPTDRPRPAKQSYAATRASIEIPNDVVDSVLELSERAQVNSSVILLAAFQALLARYSAQADIVIGFSDNQRSPETDSIIGPLTNTVAVRTRVFTEGSFLDQIKRTSENLTEACSFRAIPFARLIKELQPQRTFSYSPIFQVMFKLESAPFTCELQDLIVHEVDYATEVSEFDLSASIPALRKGHHSKFNLDYSTDLFDHSTIQRWLKNFVNLLAAMAANPKQLLSAVQIASPEESEQLIARNDTQECYSPELCVHEFFERQVERSPQEVAVVCGERQLTYEELNRRANQLAAYLTRYVSAGSLIGIHLERDVEMLIALLAVLKAGGAYVPLDPTYPPARLEFMLKDSGARVLLTQDKFVDRFADFKGHRFCLDSDWKQIETNTTANPGVVIDRDNLAYFIYTSGSTGQPKGAMITHRGLANYLMWAVEAYDVRSGIGVPMHSSISFDLTITSLFTPLLAGRSVFLVPDGIEALAEALLRRTNYSLVKITPAHLRALAEILPPGEVAGRARALVIGGEALHFQSLTFWRQHAPGTRLINEYGPTETVVGCCVYDVAPGDPFSGPVPIGHPIANTTLCVLDNRLHAVGLGETGELFIAGEGVGRGYHDQAPLTAERFVPNPFAKEAGARLYRTGDLVRRLGNRGLEFLGRLDHQVKIRGFRIELGEVMEVLSQHPLIKENIVIAAPDRVDGQRLAAYLVAKDEANMDVGTVRAFLKSKLPDYMIPAVFVTLPSLPLTSNGKIDLKALPSPDDSRLSLQAAFAKPQDSIETQLVTIWQKVLGVTRVGIDDNFFDLGGHSLLAVRLFAQIENRFGKVLPLATLFQASTIRDLATVLREEGCRQWSSLVAIRSTGSRPPLFCIHAAGANILIYRPLANHLSVEQPVYALQALGLDGVTPPLTRVEEMAAHYIREIRTLQPEGPYHLLGGSFGGLVAFEMAQQLDAQGQKIAMLALLDTYCPLRSVKQRMRGHWAHLIERGPSTYAADLFGAVAKRFRRTVLRQPARSENGGSAASVLPKEGEFEDPLVRTVEANLEAGRTYMPRNMTYRGPLLFFHAEDLGGAPAYEDNRLRWEEIATEGFEIHRIPGTHLTMREEPNVAILAGIIEDYLEQERDASASKTSMR